MLNTLKPGKAVQAAAKGGADKMIAQIEALTRVSPVTPGQARLFDEMDRLGRPLKGTVLDQLRDIPAVERAAAEADRRKCVAASLLRLNRAEAVAAAADSTTPPANRSLGLVR